MKQILLGAAFALLLASPILAGTGAELLDSNTAFYEGESLRYIIPAPRHFKMVTDEAADDGYSFAFIPKVDAYDSASVMIGVNIYKIRGMKFESVIVSDTSSMREHYGPSVTIRPVEPLTSSTMDPLTTFYLNIDRGFIPNAAMAYFDGGTEIVIFELVISEDILRFKAEELFADCVKHFRPLKQGSLDFE